MKYAKDQESWKARTEHEVMFQVTAHNKDGQPYYTGGVVFDKRTRLCIDAAPILRWLVGKRFEWFKEYVKGRTNLKVVKCKPFQGKLLKQLGED